MPRRALVALIHRAFWVAIGALVALGATSLALTAMRRDTERWVRHGREVSRLAREATLLAVDRETGIRGYLITRDTRSLAPERAARAPLRAKLDSLVRLTADNPDQQRRARAAAAALDAWERDVAAPVLAGAPAASVVPLAGKPAFDAVRARFAEFQREEEALYRSREARDVRVETIAVGAVAVELVLMLAALLVLRRRAVAQTDIVVEQREILEDQAVALEEQTAELEQQLSESQALAAELEEQRAELEQSSAELRRASADIAATSYAIAHDLRSPLRAIDGHSFLLLQRHGEALGEEGRETLGRVRANSQRMGHLIDGLLALGRIGREPLSRATRVDLSALARAAIEDLRAAEPERCVETTVADGLAAPGDPRLLATVVQNLLDNAWKFTRGNDAAGRPPARIEVGAEPAASPDGAGGAPDAAGAAGPVFYVRDNGAGFDMEFAGQLFRPFQRLHRDDEYAGFGIGLASVQRVIERHGGRIWARGGVGRGATIYFSLPGATAS
ncbi:MAG TPA: CHASE3 domain-containing protein [Gemmatimonadaceae bacterium]|nr:CHASE3 domain-containing protein [Gemmatimonadaceae bacterium]